MGSRGLERRLGGHGRIQEPLGGEGQVGEIVRRLCAWAVGLMVCGRSLQDEAQGSGLDGRTLPEIGTQ